MQHSRFNFVSLTIAAALLLSLPLRAAAFDAEAAEDTARRESCLKCHGIDKRKDGPAYRQVAAKYRGKPDAEEKLIAHVKSGRVVQLASGDEEEHRIIQTSDENEIRNLIQWILSLQ
ncbi:MAG TPA: c-type cytochrome [Noviherbaspirillum sp.]|nr:c-type cytochrome [Noviherbaspirillum sp.]